LRQRRGRYAEYGYPDFIGIMLDPARLRIILLNLLLRLLRDPPLTVEQECAGACRPLIDRGQIGCLHTASIHVVEMLTCVRSCPYSPRPDFVHHSLTSSVMRSPPRPRHLRT